MPVGGVPAGELANLGRLVLALGEQADGPREGAVGLGGGQGSVEVREGDFVAVERAVEG